MTSNTSTAPAAASPSGPIYRDASAPVADRVADLLGAMTVEEKLGQLGSAWIFELAKGGRLDPDMAAPRLAHGIGHVTRVSGASSLSATDAAMLANELQRYLVENTRLGIPAIVHEEICSGLLARDATVFPQALGVAATFRPEHNRALTDTIRRQMRAAGAHHGLSPVLDICRDPRWGRLEETYGEDPYLVTQMGVAFVEGLQGPPSEDWADAVVATAKHFVGHGASEGGLNWAPAHLPERELRDVYLRPFEAVVRDAGIGSVMHAYQEIDGVPCAANRWLLTSVLRDEWGFDGTVVSDYFAVRQVESYHHVVSTVADAAATALRAGIDVELPATDCFGAPLGEALASGAAVIEDVDRAVARVLTSKFRLGLFERPYVDVGSVPEHIRTPAQLELARRIAQDSIVLLANDGVLPLAAGSSVAVIGPNAAEPRNMLGDYTYAAHVESLRVLLSSGSETFAMSARRDVSLDPVDLGHVTTVAAELGARCSGAVVHAAGCATNDDDRSGFAAAVAAAERSDVAVLVMGDRAGLTDACTTGETRDVSSLDLPGVQEDLALAVAATGTPVVLILVAGRPLGSEALHAAAGAVVMAWLPGEQGGAAIADVLLGEISPGGKLPVSYPRSSGQVPVFYGHKVSGGRSHWKGPYVDLSNEPMYPFGFGIGYSTFEIVADAVDRPAVPGQIVDVTATVANTGAHRADEVVQLYSRDPVATITRPVAELQGFARVTLEPGASARVTFHIAVDSLGFTGADMRYVVEPGDIELLVGSSSDDVQPAGRIVVGGQGQAAVRRPATNAVDVKLL